MLTLEPMCGVTGLWVSESVPRDRLRFIDEMTRSLHHRGPDDFGTWSDREVGISMGHRRLSILDLSAEGRQPMWSPSGRYCVCYNGEIYNGGELVADVESSRGGSLSLRGHSDTEVLVAAIEQWGVRAAVRRAVGMFAIAVWDRQDRRLFLVRDRLGIKPMYYAQTADGVLWGSELKALSRFPGFPTEISRESLSELLRLGYVPSPLSIYRAARKVEPGEIITLGQPNIEQAQHERFWSAEDAAALGASNARAGADEEVVDELDRLLRVAVRQRMVSDVPLGAFLSGGIDSSAVVALMQSQTARRVRTFTIGYENAGYDESQDAARIAQHLGTDHTTLMVTQRDSREVIPLLPRIYDEPFADSSQIPVYLVSKLAKASVTVALSGDGGDEVFGGYNRHIWAPRVWNGVRAVPRAVRRALADGLLSVAPGQWDVAFEKFGLGPKVVRIPGQKVHKLARVVGAGSPGELYDQLCSHWEGARECVTGSQLPRRPTHLPAGRAREGMMLRDLVTYLPDDILTKVDRASMAVALEVRVPLLDHRVVEFAWRLDLAQRIRRGEGKWVLRRVLERYVPSALFDRPKMGFGVPVGRWLRGELRPWVESLLDESLLREDGYFEVSPIKRLWAEHASGRRDWEHALWPVLMFQAWRQAPNS